MKYVKKTKAPRFFKLDTKHLKDWGKYKSKKKRELKLHILRNEQNFLCIYCEGKVNMKDSHIEHLRPKDASKYPGKLFDYKNLTVSCNGDCQDLCLDDQPHTCGHVKANLYNEKLFLNPTELEDIEDYFIYDSDDGRILPSDKDPQRAMYMIYTVLKLNDPQLCMARKIALKSLQKKVSSYPKDKRKDVLKSLLRKESIPFISFLRYRYRAIMG